MRESSFVRLGLRFCQQDLLLLRLAVPVVRHNAKILAHFQDLKRNLDCVVLLDVEVRFARSDRVPNVLGHYQVLLLLNQFHLSSLIPLPVLNLPHLFLNQIFVFCGFLDLFLQRHQVAVLEEAEYFPFFDEFLEF